LPYNDRSPGVHDKELRDALKYFVLVEYIEDEVLQQKNTAIFFADQPIWACTDLSCSNP